MTIGVIHSHTKWLLATSLTSKGQKWSFVTLVVVSDNLIIPIKGLREVVRNNHRLHQSNEGVGNCVTSTIVYITVTNEFEWSDFFKNWKKVFPWKTKVFEAYTGITMSIFVWLFKNIKIALIYSKKIWNIYCFRTFWIYLWTKCQCFFLNDILNISA